MVASSTSVTRLAAALAAACAICLGGCAQITVVSDQAAPRSEWKFGVLAIDVPTSDQNTIVSTKGIGLISTPSGATLGYSNARIVRMGNECRVVISAKDAETINNNEELLRLLKSIPKACAA